MSKERDALKLALSTLANARDWIGNAPEGRWDEDEMYDELCNMVKFVSEALADSALDRMAENARELGLDYEPPCKTGSQCTSKCQQCEQPAQQQPDEFLLRGLLASELKCWHRLTEDEAQNLVDFVQNMPAKPAQQREPVLWLVDGVVQSSDIPKDYTGCLFTSPPASKPWVGLTDAEIDELDRKNYGFPQPVAWRGPFARAVEAKLKERNA